MMQNTRPIYDCDTSPYWCSDKDYSNSTKCYGRFIEDGSAYEILDKNTPRPWLNYLCNENFGSAFSNTGLGFTWYKTTLLRVTKYEHPIDYLPRDFQDGREVILTDNESGREWNVFRDAEDVNCIHRPGYSTITATMNGIKVTMTVFVAVEDAGECWLVSLRNTTDSKASLSIRLEQTWTFSKFGIHTAEEGIPYLSTPGEDFEVNIHEKAISAHTTNKDLPVELYGLFVSPQADRADVRDDVEPRKDGRIFTFIICTLHFELTIDTNTESQLNVFSGADEDNFIDGILAKYNSHTAFENALTEVKEMWAEILESPSCVLPDTNITNFLNVWLKNQLFLTFRFVRSGYIGYRDTLQDTWGYTLLDTERSRKQLLRTLAHMMKDGSCPRNYPPYNDKPDLRKFMDSGTWIASTLNDYIKETGETGILEEIIPYFDDETPDTVNNHVWKAMNLLFENRGTHGLCLTGDGDWNDALEGISKCGDAESAWLTMALFRAQNMMAELYRHVGDSEKADILSERSGVLHLSLNESAWDGDWFVYGFTGTGKPIGSRSNKEGQIHLNAQTWAIFSGLATDDQIQKMRKAITQHLDTPFGPALLNPPYAEEAAEVGRIANLEPGTFENGSVYQHAVAFKIFADLASGQYEEAVQTFTNMLPTNPENPDTKRSCEPYCTGNYYCGPTHSRFGQNFFTWFTGNPAWLLRAGFDEIIGVKADYDGLLIAPKVPSSWTDFSLKRKFRGTTYKFSFHRANENEEKAILVNGSPIDDNLIFVNDAKQAEVRVVF